MILVILEPIQMHWSRFLERNFSLDQTSLPMNTLFWLLQHRNSKTNIGIAVSFTKPYSAISFPIFVRVADVSLKPFPVDWNSMKSIESSRKIALQETTPTRLEWDFLVITGAQLTKFQFFLHFAFCCIAVRSISLVVICMCVCFHLSLA